MSFIGKYYFLFFDFIYIIPPQRKFGGIWVSACPFVYLSVYPSVCVTICLQSVDMVMSMHVIGEWIFLKKMYTYYISSEDVHLELSYCLDKISSFSCLFMFMDLKRTIVFKIIKTTLVKALKCVFLELIHQISYFNVQYLESCVDFHFFNLGGGGWSIHFTGLNKCSGTMHMVEFCF